MRRTSKALLTLAFALTAWSWCGRRHVPRTSLPTGMLLYVHVQRGAKLEWRWLDLATGRSGALGYYGSSHLSYVKDRHAVWMSYAGVGARSNNAALKVARDDRGVATTFVPGVAVEGVAPGGSRAALIPHHPGTAADVLQLARVVPWGFVPGETLNVPYVDTTVFGWFDEHTPLVGLHGDLLRAEPDKRPIVLRHCEGSEYGSASHDMRWFTWATDPGGDGRHMLSIISLLDRRAAPRTISIGTGRDSKCEFAPGDRTIACMVGDGYAGDATTLLVDVATGAVTSLGEHLGPSFAFSPDGQWIAIWGEDITLVPVNGRGPSIHLHTDGGPVAWIR